MRVSCPFGSRKVKVAQKELHSRRPKVFVFDFPSKFALDEKRRSPTSALTRLTIDHTRPMKCVSTQSAIVVNIDPSDVLNSVNLIMDQRKGFTYRLLDCGFAYEGPVGEYEASVVVDEWIDSVPSVRTKCLLVAL